MIIKKCALAFFAIVGLGLWCGHWPDKWNGYAMALGLFVMVCVVIAVLEWIYQERQEK